MAIKNTVSSDIFIKSLQTEFFIAMAIKNTVSSDFWSEMSIV